MNKTVYAVRIWASTGDIKMVSDEIGHSSLVMTEKYADFEISELRHDFILATTAATCTATSTVFPSSDLINIKTTKYPIKFLAYPI